MCVYDESGKPLKTRLDSSDDGDDDDEVAEEPPKKKVNLRAKSKGQPKPEPTEESEDDNDESEGEKDESESDTVPVSYHFVSHVTGVIITLGDHFKRCMYLPLVFHSYFIKKFLEGYNINVTIKEKTD